MVSQSVLFFFFFNDPATTEIYTLSLHDALPISRPSATPPSCSTVRTTSTRLHIDRKSTRLNSSHGSISYAVFCLNKKKELSTSHFSVTSATLCAATLYSYF